jgi:hypothetical protein
MSIEVSMLHFIQQYLFVCMKYVLNFEAIVTNVVHLENICLVVSLSHSHNVMDLSEIRV